MLLEPLTEYSIYKAECEKILNKYSNNNFIVTTLRPATVCGYAKRQRLDVIVNILTNFAYFKKEIQGLVQAWKPWTDNRDQRYYLLGLNLLVATLPIVIVGLFFSDFTDSRFANLN